MDYGHIRIDPTQTAAADLRSSAELAGANSLPMRDIETRLHPMVIGRIRCWFMLFVLGVFVVAGLGRPMPSAEAAPMNTAAAMADMSAHMHTHHMHDPHMHAANHALPLPCKAPVPCCDSTLGCLLMLALPLAFSPAAVPQEWSRVSYVNVAAVPTGLALQPGLGPPILV